MSFTESESKTPHSFDSGAINSRKALRKEIETELEGQQEDSYSTTRRFWIRTIGFSAGIITAVAMILISVSQYYRREDFRASLAQELNGLVPQFSTHLVTFEPDHRFEPNRDPADDGQASLKAWMGLIPKGAGTINTTVYKDPDRYNLPPEVPLPGHHGIYSISVMHQMHCLHSIMSAYVTLSKNETMRQQDPYFDELNLKAFHIDHCFDYLRQSLMCCGDTALEGKGESFPPEIIGIDGWGGKHVCKSYDEIFTWTEDNRAVDYQHL
ncbi:hypothetical protein PVAG01_11365 [Phlyctema vagabunda]|uniref:Tat pathway signal sequence n=1 Tax=Phlyctema vagabunda TaxID=108571 RepID=A0ABR4P235_9HELO